MVSETKEWMTVKNAAKHLGVCHKTILRWIKQGNLPASRMDGARLYLIDKAILDSVLTKKK